MYVHYGTALSVRDKIKIRKTQFDIVLHRTLLLWYGTILVESSFQHLYATVQYNCTTTRYSD